MFCNILQGKQVLFSVSCVIQDKLDHFKKNKKREIISKALK